MSDTATPARPTRTGLHRPDPTTIMVDGEPVTAHPGESLATALLAAGRRTTGETTSGAGKAPYCNMGVCFECVVTVDGQPFQRSCLIRVRPGLIVQTGPAR
ncbi:(2Fe-2S)-binding protein [Catellatospora sichuanensis]|uniref:(2Fe-2S)-binding protein n=1 Tax=Catellatospora sichuanensis TaxID=1969805 RepID=UPI001C912766|nr:(2Fe-2S)-binding protein [Catellatospora sichuanensis]